MHRPATSGLKMRPAGAFVILLSLSFNMDMGCATLSGNAANAPDGGKGGAGTMRDSAVAWQAPAGVPGRPA